MLQNTGKRSDTHTQREARQQIYYASCKKRTVYLCLIVNIHNIDRSVAVANKKKSVFFRLQDLQQVNIGTTINKNKIFELQTEATKKKTKNFSFQLAVNRRLKIPLQNSKALIIARTNTYSLLFDASENRRKCKATNQIYGGMLDTQSHHFPHLEMCARLSWIDQKWVDVKDLTNLLIVY